MSEGGITDCVPVSRLLLDPVLNPEGSGKYPTRTSAVKVDGLGKFSTSQRWSLLSANHLAPRKHVAIWWLCNEILGLTAVLDQ
jgi:hypothetical protein